MLGDLTIPCLMLVLGANLAKGPGAGKGMPLRCVAATCVCRLVLLPLAGTGLVLAMRAGGMLNDLQPIGVICECAASCVCATSPSACKGEQGRRGGCFAAAPLAPQPCC